jgi:hypothetical protein
MFKILKIILFFASSTFLITKNHKLHGRLFNKQLFLYAFCNYSHHTIARISLPRLGIKENASRVYNYTVRESRSPSANSEYYSTIMLCRINFCSKVYELSVAQ